MIRQLGYRQPLRDMAQARAPYAIPRPVRALGELNVDDASRWACCDTREDGSRWEQNVDTYQWRMVSPPPPPPPKVAAVSVPTLVGVDPARGYIWQMPDGSFVTTPTEQPPGAVAPAPSPLDPYQPAPAPGFLYPGPMPTTTAPSSSTMPAPGALLSTEQLTALARSWESQTGQAIPPTTVLSPITSPGVLPAGGLVAAPNFSDPAGVGSPYNATSTTVVAGAPPGAVPTSSAGSPLPWLLAAVVGFFALRG